MLRPHSALYLPLLLAASMPLRAQVLFADVALDYVHNDNLSRSVKPWAGDSGLEAAVSAGYHLQPGLYTSLNVIGVLRKTAWREFSGMNNLAAGLGVDVSHKFGIGELRPVLRAGVNYEHLDFGNDVRDATLRTAFLAAGKRFTPRLSMELRLAHERSNGDQDEPLPSMGMRPAKSGKVWDFSVRSLQLSTEYELGAASWLAARLQYRDGPVVATAQVYTQPNTAALASTYDPVFGPHAVAYRLDARTRVASIDYNRAVFERASWHAGIELQQSTASSGIGYDARLLRIGFIHGF